MRMTVVAVAISLTVIGASASADSPSSTSSSRSIPLDLPLGKYRFSGRCTKMLRVKEDLPNKCLDYMGAIVRQPRSATFVFPAVDGAWLYTVSRPGVRAADGTAITYQVETMVDLAIERKFVGGECVMRIRQERPIVHCTTWQYSNKVGVLRDVVFVGDGKWEFGAPEPTI